MKRLGIIGGGQLGKMIAEVAHKKKYFVNILDSMPDACAKPLASNFFCCPFDDYEGVKNLFNESDIITYEFENVNIATIQKVAKETNKKVLSSLELLYISQNRGREKQSTQQINIPVPPYKLITNKKDIESITSFLQFPFIIKTAEGGYDGKGQWTITTISDLQQFKYIEGVEYIAEQKINFKLEVSCIVFRAWNKSITTLPIAENIHENGILKLSIVPARINRHLSDKIILTAKKIMEDLDMYGILAIEMFIDKNDNILINEFAPRPHNSGHYSMNGCDYSQFELDIMVLENNILPSVKLKIPTVMLNILGQHHGQIEKYNFLENEFLYLYGKKENKYNRKIGHINFCGPDIEQLIFKATNFYNS